MEKFMNRRRNYYIKKKFQRNFIMKFCFLVALGSVISGLIIYAMSRATVTTSFENSRLIIKSTADFILPAVMLSGAVVILLTGLATIAITLLTSHKIAGPLYRLEKDVDEVARGNLRMAFKLRQGDEIKALAASLNNMVRELKVRAADIKNAAEDLDSITASKPEIPSEIREKVRRICALSDRFTT
jgi:methyl-accepting chemotaxis protein